MARFNSVTLMGKVSKMVARPVGKSKTNGIEGDYVLNFQLGYFSEKYKRTFRIPIAVWGEKEVNQCLNHMQEDDYVIVQGEIRHKFIWVDVLDEEGKKIMDLKTGFPVQKLERVYTAVKANTIEFVSKKMKKDEKFYHYINEIRLLGNLVDDPKPGDEGFVVAVDRKHSVKQTKSTKDDLTDYVTLVVKDESILTSNLKKGSVVIIDGEIMTRKHSETIVAPTVVVDVKRIVGR